MPNKEPKFDCKCIDIESLTDLKVALLTARDTYNDIASRLIGMEELPPPIIKNIKEKAEKFHLLLDELDRIPPC